MWIYITGWLCQNDSHQLVGIPDHVSEEASPLTTNSYSKMSGATPTLIPRESIFPRLLPKAPQPHPIPLPRKRVHGHLNAFRDLQREMDDLSDEENELEDLVSLSTEKCNIF